MSWVYLSHILSDATPLYGGHGSVRIERLSSIAQGDSSNNSSLSLPAHAGTHLDAPNHFDLNGAHLDTFPPEYWQAVSPWLVDALCKEGEILGLQRLGEVLEEIPEECDLLLLRTGAEQWRSSDPAVYAGKGPGVAPEVASWLRRHRRLRFFGIDCISVSSYLNREVGRSAHKSFLSLHEADSPPIAIIEDMALGKLGVCPKLVWIVPLLYCQADGSPVTVLAQL